MWQFFVKLKVWLFNAAKGRTQEPNVFAIARAVWQDISSSFVGHG